MIQQLIEELFKPHDEKEVRIRREPLFELMDEFERLIDPSLPNAIEEDLAVEKFDEEHPEVMWEAFVYYLEGGQRGALDEDELDLFDAYMEWEGHS